MTVRVLALSFGNSDKVRIGGSGRNGGDYDFTQGLIMVTETLRG